jgi:hypothetical protein
MLDDKKEKCLEKISGGIKILDDTLISDSVAYHFLETKGRGHGEFIIQGNAEGMIHLARVILELALTSFNGKHHHFDDNGILEDGSKPFIISFKNAD